MTHPEVTHYFAMAAVKRKARLAIQGLCNRCGKAPPKPGCKACASCIDREAVGVKRRREAAKNEA